MTDLSQSFSRQAKIALADYLLDGNVILRELEILLEKIKLCNLENLQDDQSKMAFWINMYNGFTNYQILKFKLRKTVWEKPDFFTQRWLVIGGIDWSLDDIEHGILRRNGSRKNNKPRQFNTGDSRVTFMVDKVDPKIHFALNCGSKSCPPVAYYSEANIEQELTLAEESFAAQEFHVLEHKNEVHCSSIFVWYKSDFEKRFLNDPKLSHFSVVERPYIWNIQ